MSDIPRIGDSFTDPSQQEDAVEAYSLKAFGVGIDCHSRFIQVCVNVRNENGVKRHEQQFTTSWNQLCQARDWCIETILKYGDQDAIDTLDSHGLAYTIESTGTYHLPIIRAFGGIPSVVNPLLASPSRRKTDVLDSRLLAYHAITGMWPVSYLAPMPIQTLRIFLNMREDAKRMALRASNRINNFLLRYGHTIGAEDPVVSSRGRAIIQDLLEDRPVRSNGVCPDGIPPTVRPVFYELYKEYDDAISKVKKYEQIAQKTADTTEFTLGTGEIVNGTRLKELLLSIPGFGPLSTLYWMTEVITPTRFPNAKALAAYAGCDPSLKVSAGKVTSQARRGGNQKLHSALTHAAQILIARPKEALGNWGYNMWKRQKKGGFKKACGAVARRMIEASYHVSNRGEMFKYELYTYFEPTRYDGKVLTVDEYGRYAKLLSHYSTADELGKAYDSGALSQIRGVGEKCLMHVKVILQPHVKK